MLHIVLVSMFLLLGRTHVGDTLDAYTLDRRQVTLDDSTIVVVLFGAYSCSSCYGQLVGAIRQVAPDRNICCLIKPTSDVMTNRRAQLQQARRLVKADSYLFDIPDRSDQILDTAATGVFGKFKVLHTPAMIVIRGSQQPVYFDFKSLFHSDSNQLMTYDDSTLRVAVQEALDKTK